MKVFYAFLIMLTAAILFMLPLTSMVYDFRTDQRHENFTVTTASAVTSANVTLLTAVFDNDSSTITYSSSAAETPYTASFNATTKQLLVAGLTASTTRLLEITYDVDAIAGEGTAINSLLDRVPALYLLIIICFPIAGLAAIFLNRA